MTIIFKTGNILDAKEHLIIQQVNYKKVMGGGLAKQIRNKWPEIFNGYCKFIDENDWDDIKETGSAYIFSIGDTWRNPQFIYNIFGQKDFGNDKRYTDYVSLKNSLKELHRMAMHNLYDWKPYTIAIPDHLGCGLAGGDWDNVVYPIIKEIFGQSEVQCFIYKLDE